MTATGSLGHILLQPERLQRSGAAVGEDALIDDLLAAISRVTADGAGGGTIVQDLEAAAEALAARLLDRAGSGLHRAIARLQDLVRPLAALAERLPAMFDHDDPADVAAAVIEQLGSFADLAGGLTIERLREQLTLLLDVLQEDLGLTSAALEEEFWLLLDDVIERVETIPDGLDATLRANRDVLADVLRRVRRHLHGAIAVPELRADRLATLLFEVLEPLLGESVDKLACLGHVTGDTLEAVTGVLRTVPYTGFGSHSIGAADAPEPAQREYLWYPSWLIGGREAHFYAPWQVPAVWVDRSAGPAQIRFRTDALYAGEAFRWTNIPIGDGLPSVSFKHVDADAMEKIAWHSAWVAEGVEALFHLWSPLAGETGAKGGQPSWVDILDFLVGGMHTGLKSFKQMPFEFLAKPGESAGRVYSWLPTVGAHGLGSLQGMHTKAAAGNVVKMQGLIVLSDAIRYIGAASLPGLLREGLLSFLTVYNYDGPTDVQDSSPINHEAMDGLLAVFQLVGTVVSVKVTVDLKYYGHPFTGNSAQVPDFNLTVWLRNNLLLGTVFGAVNGLLSTLLVWALTAATSSPAVSPGVLGKNIGYATLKSVLLFWVNVYAWRENNTDKGRYNPAGAAFAGYPEKDTSPYKLPWNGGETYMCFQGNMGYFSHNNTNPGGSQIYAYDFMLDKGDEVRAARAGTVVDYFDWCPNDQYVTTTPASGPIPGQTASDAWNFITIRHDAADAHDVGAGGAAVTTYGVYGHGLNSGVRDVFAARPAPIAPASIIGTTVAQGDAIMLADSTGVSACNHLHMQVNAGPAATVAAPIDRSRLGDTIPFVFADGGQPDSRSWLLSDNVKRP